MKIYTRTGDGGETGLFSGRRVSKADLRVEAYGTVDELNACLGVLRDHVPEGESTYMHIREQLLELQRELFSLGAMLADDRPEGSYRLSADAATALEAYMDEMDRSLPKMTHFILPGGSQAVSFAHLARTVCRRAERRIVVLDGVDTTAVVYVNRLSDYLFVLARYLGKLGGIAEIKWLAE
ncbi:cob(I)alamin adenosyltransferase [Neolewinella xylanilytica]|uniref:Corrinoid adenosyltransferase n=1 Tax=Neolewinella xylanilytica TaxID=1514080 RepID=A0A2S6IBQ1_9BACT|nr:cob(I)yrinic acid a,c-diamide adenosyltransferase [Neolewinella xylanilytica]PPK88896.1 cob(I)alamin adenosyltransferase [Neolewinella xylanilytica]